MTSLDDIITNDITSNTDDIITNDITNNTDDIILNLTRCYHIMSMYVCTYAPLKLSTIMTIAGQVHVL